MKIPTWVVFFVIVVLVFLTGAFAWRSWTPPSPVTGASASASASAAPSASASVASERPQVPYHSGEYKTFLPTGSITLVMEDGGVVRFHDGNEHPCSYGCAAMYSQAMQAEMQRMGGKLVDGPEIQRDAESCIRACMASGGDRLFWPPVEK